MSGIGSSFSFGIPTATSAPTGQAMQASRAFSFTAPSTQSLFTFRPTTPSLTAGGLGTGSLGIGGLFQPPATTAAPTFGSSMFSFGAQPTTSAPTLFGSTLGTPTTTTASTTNPQEEVVKYVLTLTSPQLYGDERDVIIGKLNQIMAFLGCGHGYYNNSVPPLPFPPTNPFSRLKFVGYNRRMTCRNEDGFVALLVRRSVQEINDGRQMFIDCLYKILGSKPTLAVHIETIKQLHDGRCEVTIFIVEANPTTGLKRTVPATEVYGFLIQPATKSALQSQMAVEEIAPKADVLEEKLKEYLVVPPPGFDASVWAQAQVDNPDTKSLIPWPINGFDELLDRHRMQVHEIKLQQMSLAAIVDNLKKEDHFSALIQLHLNKVKSAQRLLAHRLLLVMAAELLKFRRHMALDHDEESLSLRLQRIDSNLNGPLQLAGNLSEALSRIRNQPENVTFASATENLEPNFIEAVGQYLQRTQDALAKIVPLVSADVKMLEELEQSRVQQDNIQ